MQQPWESRDHAALAAETGAARAADAGPALARLAELVGVVYRLRDPDGCPWDRKQTVDSMARNLVEEACEAAEAIATGDADHVAEELGDVLMNVVLMARIAEQAGRFDLGEVARGIATKLVRRHPHVFGDMDAADADAALASWEASKRAEGKASGGALAGVASGLPALLAALKIGQKAAATGFDWPSADGALDKLREELDELAAASTPAELEDELGDVLFAAVNVARKHGLDPEQALQRATAKFRRRFAVVEAHFGERLGDTPLQDLERVWRTEARGA